MTATLKCDQLVEGALEVRGQKFSFYLEQKIIDLGPTGTVQYFYMPLSRLRNDDPTQDVSNFRSCIGFSYAQMQQAGLGDDPIQQINFILATSYALFHRDKGPQSVCRDALLRPQHVHPEKLSLSDDVRQRIRTAVASRDPTTIRNEMGTALEAKQFAPLETHAISRAMDEWVGRGLSLFRTSGREGLYTWLGEVDKWTKRFRKRSDPGVRAFLNTFACEAKLAFYFCYANFWIGLLPWLEQEHGLDPMSNRFLRLWHNQNQPVEVPHGRTIVGIVYPTTAGRRILLPDETGNNRLDELWWTTAHVGPEVVPDVFWGQVLALHQLNWILLARPELCAQVGNYIASNRCATALPSGNVSRFPEYWEMVEAVLTAAYLYQVAWLEYESKRTVKPLRGADFLNTDGSERPAAPHKHRTATPETLFRDYVDELKTLCPCGGHYIFVAADLPAAEGDEVLVPVVCKSCGIPSGVTVTRQKLKQFLQTGGNS